MWVNREGFRERDRLLCRMTRLTAKTRSALSKGRDCGRGQSQFLSSVSVNYFLTGPSLHRIPFTVVVVYGLKPEDRCHRDRGRLLQLLCIRPGVNEHNVQRDECSTADSYCFAFFASLPCF